jgi:hypothetical protein
VHPPKLFSAAAGKTLEICGGKGLKDSPAVGRAVIRTTKLSSTHPAISTLFIEKPPEIMLFLKQKNADGLGDNP